MALYLAAFVTRDRERYDLTYLVFDIGETLVLFDVVSVTTIL